MGDGEAFVILLVDAVDDGARGLAIDGHVEPADAAIDLLLQPLTDGFEVGGHFLDIEHTPLVDEVDRGNGDIGEHIDDASGSLRPTMPVTLEEPSTMAATKLLEFSFAISDIFYFCDDLMPMTWLP